MFLGNIPSWISGNFLKIGPAKFEQSSEKYNHYFDGMSLMHCFSIRDGSAVYHRYVF